MREIQNDAMLEVDLNSTSPVTRCYAYLVRSVADIEKPSYDYVASFRKAQEVGISQIYIDRAIKNGHILRQSRNSSLKGLSQ